MKAVRNKLSILPLALLALLLAACGGGGGSFSLDGGPVSGSFDVNTSTIPPEVYSFSVTTGTPYTIAMVSTSGNGDLWVADANLWTEPSNYLGGSFNSASNLDNYSFIATTDMTVYATTLWSALSAYSYTLEATSNNLAVDGGSKTASTYNNDLFYSFDAVSGTGYEVRLAPTSGNVDLWVYSDQALTNLVGSSSNAGTTADSVVFLAAASQRHYIRVASTSVDSTFGINVLTPPTDPDLIVTIDSVASDGVNVTIDYTVQNVGLTAAGSFDVDLWANATTAPVVGDTGDTSATYASLAGLGASVSGQVVIANSSTSGTAYAIVDTVNAVTEGDENNNLSGGTTWETPPTAPISYDFETGLIPGAFVMSGNAGWAIDNTTAGGGTYSLGSADIGDSQTACFAVTAFSSLSASFDYRVSSETSYDFLRFYIDGVQQIAWSGTVAWATSATYTTTLGTHEYKWCYTKDGSVSSGSDMAWVDNISIN